MGVFGRQWFRLGAVVGLLTLVAVVPALTRAQPASLDSGAVGLTRPEMEARWGASRGPFTGPGSYFNIYDMYTYEAQNVNYAVAYQDTNGREIAVYVEVVWVSPVSEREARAAVTALLPADASRTGLYMAPPTPAGQTALVAYQYESAALDAAYDNLLAGDILVIQQERWQDDAGPDGGEVLAVSLIVRTITQ